MLATLVPSILGFPGFSGALLVVLATNPALQILVALIGAIGAMAAGGMSLFGELRKIRHAADAARVGAETAVAQTELRFGELKFRVETAIESADKAHLAAAKVDRRMDDLYQWWIDRKEGT